MNFDSDYARVNFDIIVDIIAIFDRTKGVSTYEA